MYCLALAAANWGEQQDFFVFYAMLPCHVGSLDRGIRHIYGRNEGTHPLPPFWNLSTHGPSYNLSNLDKLTILLS